MKNLLSNCLLLITLVFIFSSCGQSHKIMKSQDTELMYQTGVQMYMEKKNEKAIAFFEMIDYVYAGTAREDTIKFYTAVSYYRRGEYHTAAELLQQFRRQFGRSPFIEEAEYLIGMGYYLLSPNAELDQTPTQMAMIQFHEYLERYPHSVKYEEIVDILTELQQKLYDKSYLNAKLYYDIGYYKSAIHTLKLALSEYPESTRREDILYLLAKSNYILASNSFENLQRSRYLDVIDSYYNFVSEYPESKYIKEVEPMYEKAQSAIKEYNEDGKPAAIEQIEN